MASINLYAFGILFIAIITLVCSVIYWKKMIKKRRAAQIRKNAEMIQEIAQENPLTY